MDNPPREINLTWISLVNEFLRLSQPIRVVEPDSLPNHTFPVQA